MKLEGIDKISLDLCDSIAEVRKANKRHQKLTDKYESHYQYEIEDQQAKSFEDLREKLKNFRNAMEEYLGWEGDY